MTSYRVPGLSCPRSGDVWGPLASPGAKATAGEWVRLLPWTWTCCRACRIAMDGDAKPLASETWSLYCLNPEQAHGDEPPALGHCCRTSRAHRHVARGPILYVVQRMVRAQSLEQLSTPPAGAEARSQSNTPGEGHLIRQGTLNLGWPSSSPAPFLLNLKSATGLINDV